MIIDDIISIGQWTRKPPTESGTYWHWWGDNKSAPFVFNVGFSGTKRKCFIQKGHGGMKDPQW
ncbi:hypothetical protein [Aliiglaciecola sp. M165]|uniref:hypothetical protein n=1 Tax=Aliiglaciecola sp. M165 TaxID=2593649 RepID=UPI00118039B8|nr:hypothetical protein [Aliiglaciecola sp. M165]TRY29791.1 hypothetical protein FM019_16605 [Aliiglaciecola sp. M165]